MTTRFILMLLVILMAAPSLMADRRKFAWAYQAVTIAPDATELEFYQTTKIDDKNSWEYKVELENGLTHKWDFSVYQIFAQKEGESLSWDAFQLRTRYRLADPGQFFLDPVLYLEYNRKTDLKKQNKLEGKLILGRDFDRVTFAFIPVYEFFWAPSEPVHELGLDVGIAYELSYKVSVGLESTSRVEFVDGENEVGSYFGPTVSLASGSVYYTLGWVWGLTDDSNDARVRFLMGVGL